MWQAATLAAAAAAAMEWGRLSGLPEKASVIYAGLFAILCLLGTALLAGDTVAGDALLAAASLFWVLLAPMVLLRRGKLPGWFLRTAGMILLFAAWRAAALMFADDVAILTMAVLLVALADAAAYLFGKALGRAKMAPEISPGKTWEGFFGGTVAVLAAAAFVSANDYAPAPAAWLMAAAFALVVLSVLGDLFASLLKRQAGVKDSGRWLGAHGGVIDRLDAMLPALPFAALLSQ